MLDAAFGRWTVVARAENSVRGNARWLCRCSCGTERVVLGPRLRFGASLSCGCARTEKLRARNKDNGMVPSLAGEAWRSVPDLVNGEPVEASSYGRVRNVISGHVYKPRIYFGYQLVHVGNSFAKVHRLVAGAFIPNPGRKPTVNHKNGVKSDNVPDNLEWATYAENIQHACDTGLLPPNLGERNGCSKLTVAAVHQIRRWHPLGLRQVDLAEAFGVSQRAISLVVRKEKWAHV